jgi:O-antigen/teichoic acid export membrane protein
VSRRFAHNSILGALAGSSITLGSFLSGVIVARALGVEGSGAVAYAVWLVLMIAPVIDIGMPSAAVRYVSEIRGRGRNDDAERLSGHLVRVLAVPVIIAICVIIAIAFLSGRSQHAWLPRAGDPAGFFGFEAAGMLIAFYVAAQVFASYNYAYLRGVQDFDTVARFAAGSLALQLVCVAAGSTYFGIAGAVAGYMAGQILPAVATLRLLRRSGPLDRELQERVGRYSRYAWAANVANAFVWSRLEVFFLERYWGNEAVAMFTVGLALTALAAQGPMLLTTGLLSFLSEKHGRSEIEAMKEAFATSTRILAALAFPACLGMAAIMPVLLPLIYGKAFAPAVPAAILLACAAAISVTSIVATNLVQAVERSEFIFFSSVFGALLAVLAGFLLVPSFGVMGAAVSRTAIQATIVAVGLWFVARHLGYPPPLASLGRLLLAALIAASSAVVCVVAIDHPFSILIAIPTAMGIYITALRMTRALPASDLVHLAKLARALPTPLVDVACRILNFVGGSMSPTEGKRPQETGSR